MDIVQLRYFLKTAQHLNYTRAAEELFITRQSLRQAIASMEQELGTPLFCNQRNHLTLTECGAYLALAGAGVVRSFDEMWANAAALATQGSTLLVAFSLSLTPFLLPNLNEVLQRFEVRFPHIHLALRWWEMDRVAAAAEAGEIDCGYVLQMPCERPNCTTRVLRSFPAALNYGEGSPLSGRSPQPLSLEELDGLPCIGMGSAQTFIRPLWEDCRARGIRLNYQVVPNTIDAFYQVQNALAAGFDILDNAGLSAPSVRSAPLAGYHLDLVTLRPNGRPNRALTDLFCAFLDEEFSQLEQGRV